MTEPPAGPPVGLLLRLAHVRARSAFTAALEPLGLLSHQYGVLRVLATRGPSSQRQIADAVSGDKSTMVRIVDDLERRGLVLRRPAAGDRRAYAVELTGEGRDLYRKADAIAAAVAAELLAGFSPEERRTLTDLLVRFVRDA
ncbi:MarR family winged helix-turn-helix transcriptional regulator [Actinomadura parmotrematis]|uniref:MarR family transcriptional regulator n=1 Tax=Actinomadura parmotrematis TaxID=2864039 RepID=A0ABS7FRD2_9ACTN|nr:MarR family transcriptional regulator [Actinomadura parmotrematis]MBW8482926.1 MarR family transcriptional regulator [Actinomadura parmotrematis]